MSKEEILNEHGFFGHIEQLTPAMDRWAEQESISFAEWMADNNIFYHRHYKKYAVGDGSYTASELYQLFLASKK